MRTGALWLLRQRRGVDLVEDVFWLGQRRAELLEEVGREPLVAGGASVVAAQGGAAELSVLLRRQALGEGGVVVPEVLVVLGAIGTGGLDRRGADDGRKSEKRNC